MVSNVSYAALAAAAVLASTAQAHQTIYIPAPTFTTTDKITKSNPIAFLENQGYKPNGDINGFLKSKGAKTLRDFMDNKANYKNDAAGATFECGYTNPNGKRQPIPANGMMRSSGYTHEGPCEIWIDNTRVLGSSSGNCHKDIPGAPVSYKIDFSVCKGDCLIRWYWLAKRLIGSKWSWQVYKECVPIRAGAARSLDDPEDASSLAHASGNSTESESAYDADAQSYAMVENDNEDTESYRYDDDDDGDADAAATTPEEPTESYRMDGNDDEEETAPATPEEPTESYRMSEYNEEEAEAEETPSSD